MADYTLQPELNLNEKEPEGDWAPKIDEQEFLMHARRELEFLVGDFYLVQT